MLDMNFIRNNPEAVKENIRKKFQDEKLPLVDKAIELDKQYRTYKAMDDNLRNQKNVVSKEIGKLIGQGKKEEAEAAKKKVSEFADELHENEIKEEQLYAQLRETLMFIPNMIADDVPIGKDDSFNVEEQRFGEPVVPDFEIPYHSDIMARFNGLDKDAAARVTGNGFYYLMGDIARLHSAVLAYVRDFMIDVIGEKYQSQVLHFDKTDVNHFFVQLMSRVDVVSTWSDSTIGKIKSVLIKCLAETGYLTTIRSTMLNPVSVDEELIDLIRDRGEYEFLAAFNEI